jgi:hypothetical protein
MEVVYTADGHQTMHVGMRLPFAGENLEDVIKLSAPIGFWMEQALSVTVPATGVTGVITIPTPPVFAPGTTLPENQPVATGAQEL